MTNERKEFIDKYIKEIISTPNDHHCTLFSLVGSACKDCQLGNSAYCFNPWYVNIFTLQATANRKDENYNNNINEILTYIFDTYPEAFI